MCKSYQDTIVYIVHEGRLCTTVHVFTLNVYRFMTCCCVLDFNTVAAADKFGNVSIVSSHAVIGVFTNVQ